MRPNALEFALYAPKPSKGLALTGVRFGLLGRPLVTHPDGATAQFSLRRQREIRSAPEKRADWRNRCRMNSPGIACFAGATNSSDMQKTSRRKSPS